MTFKLIDLVNFYLLCCAVGVCRVLFLAIIDVIRLTRYPELANLPHPSGRDSPGYWEFELIQVVPVLNIILMLFILFNKGERLWKSKRKQNRDGGK